MISEIQVFSRASLTQPRTIPTISYSHIQYNLHCHVPVYISQNNARIRFEDKTFYR